MNNILFDRINSYFREREFQRIPTDSDTVNMYATYQKSSLYLINVIALDSQYAFDIDRYNAYKALTKKQFEGAQADKIILLNLMLMEDPSRVYDVVNIDPELEEQFIDIYWLIDTEKNELIFPSKQVNSVMSLEKDLATIIGLKEVNRLKLAKVERPPILTLALILMNCLVWVVLQARGGSYDLNNLVNSGALYAPYVLEYNEYWRLFTSNYLHIGATHLFFNCFSLYIFGSRLEKYLSKVQLFIVYTSAGLIGSTFSLVSNLVTGFYPVSAGASGAVYGLIGCIIVCSKLTGKAIDGLNAYVMGVFFILGMAFSAMSPNVDSAAHVGGFIGGILITLILLTRPKKINEQNPSIE